MVANYNKSDMQNALEYLRKVGEICLEDETEKTYGLREVSYMIESMGRRIEELEEQNLIKDNKIAMLQQTVDERNIKIRDMNSKDEMIRMKLIKAYRETNEEMKNRMKQKEKENDASNKTMIKKIQAKDDILRMKIAYAYQTANQELSKKLKRSEGDNSILQRIISNMEEENTKKDMLACEVQDERNDLHGKLCDSARDKKAMYKESKIKDQKIAQLQETVDETDVKIRNMAIKDEMIRMKLVKAYREKNEEMKNRMKQKEKENDESNKTMIRKIQQKDDILRMKIAYAYQTTNQELSKKLKRSQDDNDILRRKISDLEDEKNKKDMLASHVQDERNNLHEKLCNSARDKKAMHKEIQILREKIAHLNRIKIDGSTSDRMDGEARACDYELKRNVKSASVLLTAGESHSGVRGAMHTPPRNTEA